MNEYTFNIDPCPAPRMTQRDKFAPSKAVSKYFGFRNEMKYLAYIQGLENLPGSIDSIKFSIPMPASWSQKKRSEMNGNPHTQTPDLDNLVKGTLDALCPVDSHIHTIGAIKKIWSETGSIKISVNSDNQSHTEQGEFFVDQSLY